MRPIYPLPLYHSWPLADLGARFDMGRADDHDVVAAMDQGLAVPDPALFGAHGIGVWDCDLADDSLTWSEAVYDLFGLPRDAIPARNQIVALYAEGSRAAMERLRAYAIKHQRGFTLDAEIRPDRGARRWMRLIAAPVCVDGEVVRLHGLKLDVTDCYR